MSRNHVASARPVAASERCPLDVDITFSCLPFIGGVEKTLENGFRVHDNKIPVYRCCSQKK